MRPAIWLLPRRSKLPGSSSEKATPTRTTTAAPVRAKRTERLVAFGSRLAMPSAMPMIGVDSGAMIIAPITVAVESASTPAVAMTAESASMVQNADSFDRASPDARSRSSVSSARVRRCTSGSTRSERRPGMA